MMRVREHYFGYIDAGMTTGSLDLDVLSFSPEPDAEYFYIWTMSVSCSDDSKTFSVSVLPDGENVDLDASRMGIRKSDAAGNWRYPIGGVGLIQFGSTPPATNTIKMSFSGSSASTYGINGNILVLRKTDRDFFFEQSPLTDVTTNTSGALISGGWTPDQQGSNYLKIVSFVKKYSEVNDVGRYMSHRFYWMGTLPGEERIFSASNPRDNESEIASIHFENTFGPASGSVNFRIDHASSDTGETTTTSYARAAFININFVEFIEEDSQTFMDPRTSSLLFSFLRMGDMPDTSYPFVVLASSVFGSDGGDVIVDVEGVSGFPYISSEMLLDSSALMGFAGTPPFIPNDYCFMAYEPSNTVNDLIRLRFADLSNGLGVAGGYAYITGLSLAELDNGALPAINGIIQS